MDARRVITLLHEHQDAVLAHFVEAAALMRDDPAQAAAPMARARWEALRLVRRYQLFKHAELFDPLIANGTLEQRRSAERMKERCIEAMQRFVDHVTRWSVTGAAADWDGYREAVAQLIGHMRAAIATERLEAAALLAGVTEVRTMPRARSSHGGGRTAAVA